MAFFQMAARAHHAAVIRAIYSRGHSHRQRTFNGANEADGTDGGWTRPSSRWFGPTTRDDPQNN